MFKDQRSNMVKIFNFSPCTRSSYEIHLEDISDYIDDVNEQIFNSRGINVCNPMEHGMRAVSGERDRTNYYVERNKYT